MKPLILKVWDVTYVEYHRRGLEEFPEEIPTLFDWMDHHRRDPFPKAFEAVTARTCDSRFYGVVIREFGPGRTTAPEAVEVLGQNLSPARLTMKTSVLGNLINLKTVGIDRRKLDVWLSPKIIDFKRKFEVRINDRPRYKGGREAHPGLAPGRPPPSRRPPADLLGEDPGQLNQISIHDRAFVETRRGSPDPRLGS